MNQEKTDKELFARLSTLMADERRHLLQLLESGTILDCSRSKTKEELHAWALAQKRQCHVNVTARDLIRWVEGPRHAHEEIRDHNGRLKDTGRWAEFYSAVKALDSENAEPSNRGSANES